MTHPATTWRDLKSLHKYLNLEGKLLVWTKIHIAPAGFEHQAPYIMGIIELESSERIITQIVDCDESELLLNQKVKTVIRRVGKSKPDEIIEYTVKVTPI